MQAFDGGARFPQFVQALTQLVDAPPGGGEAALLAAAKPLLAGLVAHDDWLPQVCAQPDAQHYQQHLLHADPAGRFSVVSFVWGPGQRTPVHDHTVWGLVGMLRGAECSERFAAGAPGQPMQLLGSETLLPGAVDTVSPTVGDIHRVANAHADRVSVSIHVYGGNIGRIRRHVFDPATGASMDFVSGYASVAAAAVPPYVPPYVPTYLPTDAPPVMPAAAPGTPSSHAAGHAAAN